MVIAKSADAMASTTVNSMIVKAFLPAIDASSVHGILGREDGDFVIGILRQAPKKFGLSQVHRLRYIYPSSHQGKSVKIAIEYCVL
jgi:hypothetical protein